MVKCLFFHWGKFALELDNHIVLIKSYVKHCLKWGNAICWNIIIAVEISVYSLVKFNGIGLKS